MYTMHSPTIRYVGRSARRASLDQGKLRSGWFRLKRRAVLIQLLQNDISFSHSHSLIHHIKNDGHRKMSAFVGIYKFARNDNFEDYITKMGEKSDDGCNRADQNH